MSEPELRANPYVGLRPFFDRDSLYFFGRETQTAELLEILRQHRFLGIVGSSGSGKSSLVRAGLLPGLLGGFLVHDRDRWRTVQMKPGDAPMGNLVAGLTAAMGLPATAEAVAALESDVRERHTEAVLECLKTRLEPNANLFLLVDQFEEIFAFRGLQDEDAVQNLDLARRKERARRKAEAADFVDLLLTLADQRALPIYVTLTMRTDFLGDCDLFYGLPEALNRGRYLVPRMTREQLRDAVECPAMLLGASVAPRLLDHVLNELGDRFDRLPVLQHALLRTWDEWQRAGGLGPVDLVHYESAGGLEGALDQDAERALEGLDPDMTARAFKRLTDTDLGQRRVRSPARISELMAVAGADRAAIEAMVLRFEENNRSFLFRSSDGKPEDKRVDIAHESLIRQWDRLREWVDEERQSRDQYKKLVDRAHAGTRLLDPELQRVLNWWATENPSRAWAQRYSTNDVDFDDAERCLRESEHARDAELEREREQARAERLNKERELEQAKALAEAQRLRAEEQAVATTRQRRLNRGLAALLAVAVATVVVAVVFYVSANRALETATSERAQRMSQQLVAEAGSESERGAIQLAMLFAAAGIREDSTAETQARVRRLLLAQTNLRAFLSGHSGTVSSVAFSPDGRTLASAGWDGTVILWDVEGRKPRGAPLSVKEREGLVVTSVAFGVNNTLATGGSDGTVILWRQVDGSPRAEILETKHAGTVTSVAFSPDGATLASASEGELEARGPGAAPAQASRTLILWDVATGQPRGAPLQGHAGAVASVAFSPDGSTVVSTGADDKQLVLWDVNARRPPAAVTLEDPLSGAVFSPDGKTFAVVSVGVVSLVDVTSGTRVVVLNSDEGALGVAFSFDGNLAVASTDGSVARWDLANREQPKPLPPFKGHFEYVTSVAFSSDGQTLASGSADGTVILWDAASSQLQGKPLEHDGPVADFAFGPGPETPTVASASKDGVIFWDLATRQRLGELKGNQGFVTSIAFSPNGKVLATVSDGTVMLYDAAGRKPLGEPLKVDQGELMSVAFSRDGQTLASGTVDGTVILWDVAKRVELGRLKGHENPVASVAFSPDALRPTLASGSFDGTVILWDLATRQPLGGPLKGSDYIVTSVAFSPDGEKLASGTGDFAVMLWKVATRQQLGLPMKRHKNIVTSLAFSPDSKTLASGSADSTVILWDVESRRPFAEPLGHEGPVSSVAFSPDGQMLGSGSTDDDGTVILWNASLWKVDVKLWVAQLCGKANRNLTRAEWEERVGKDEPYRQVCTNLPMPSDIAR